MADEKLITEFKVDPTPSPGEDQYWKEEAERVNAQREAAIRLGIVLPNTDAGPPPKLNPDGSLAEDDEDDDAGS